MPSFEERGNSVRAVVRLPGGRKKSLTFDTLSEAEQWASKMEDKVARGLVGKGGTVGELFELFEPIALATDSAKFNGLRLLKWCKDPIVTLKVAEVVTHDINAWISRSLSQVNEKTGKKLSNATVRRELNLLSTAFNYAIDGVRWIKVNPCHGAQRPPETRPRGRPMLSPDELRAIRISTGYDADPKLGTIGARTGACFLFTLETGMRSGEALRIRPKDLHRKESYVHISATEKGGRKGSKSGRASVDPSRNVPLTPRAVELLDQLLATMPKDRKPVVGFSDPPYIFGINDSQRDSHWRKALKKAGVTGLTFHDSKHEAATRLARFIDVFALSHAIGTKNLSILRDTYYNSNAAGAALLLPAQLSPVLPNVTTKGC